MRYFLAHLPDRPGRPWQESDPHEEVYVLSLGTKVAVAVPVGSLRLALPVFAEASADLPPACCSACGGCLPAPTRDG